MMSSSITGRNSVYFNGQIFKPLWIMKIESPPIKSLCNDVISLCCSSSEMAYSILDHFHIRTCVFFNLILSNVYLGQ